MSHDTSNERNEIVNQIFKDTNLKFTEDDPIIDFVSIINKFSKKTQDDLNKIGDELIDKIKAELDWSNEYFVGNSENHIQNIEKKFSELINSIDEKNKELNFVLVKIQADYDKQSDERFEKYFVRLSLEQTKTIDNIQKLHNDMLKRQRKIDTSKQHDIIIAGIGAVVGIVITLLLLFLLK